MGARGIESDRERFQVIKSVLDEKRGNKEAAVSALLEIASD
jgi:hypothetical protein